MLQFLIGYGLFFLGSVIYLLIKARDYKQLADKVPNSDVQATFKDFWNKEWINMFILWLAGIAVVLFLPQLIGGSTVDLKSAAGNVITTVSLKTALTPMEFILGYSGNSVVFALLGKYKKSLLSQMGVDEKNPDI